MGMRTKTSLIPTSTNRRCPMQATTMTVVVLLIDPNWTPTTNCHPKLGRNRPPWMLLFWTMTFFKTTTVRTRNPSRCHHPPPSSDVLGDNMADGPGPSQEQVDSWVEEVVDKTVEEQDAVEDFQEDFLDNDQIPSNGGNPNDAMYQDDNFKVAEFDENSMDDVFNEGAEAHHEDPEAVNVGIAADTKKSQFPLTGSVVALLVVIALIALVLKRRKKRKPTSVSKQQELFQKTYDRAEKKMLQEHRNLNYRNHHSPRELDAIDLALDELSYTNESFHDEVDNNNTSQDSDENGDGEDEFVLDSDILMNMN